MKTIINKPNLLCEFRKKEKEERIVSFMCNEKATYIS